MPRLKKDPEFPEPQAEDFNTIHEYADQFNAYLIFEELSDPPCSYSQRAQVKKFIKNLGPAYATAVERIELTMDSWKDSEPAPLTLQLHFLPKTVENYNTKSNNGIIRAANGGNSTKYFGKPQQTKTSSSDSAKPCNACMIPGHFAAECHAL